MNEPALYLIPVNLSDAPLERVLPQWNISLAGTLRHYIVENVRTARRFLKKCDRSIDINAITFYELNVRTPDADIDSMLAPILRGESVGLMSEAGCPAVADPGAQAVKVAQQKGMKVVPLIGPSSILLGLMGSGFNGQGFTFHGYLPIDASARQRKIKEMETESIRRDVTQIFIETPYRNNKMLATLAAVLRPDTPVCVAANITDPERESILTLPASKWRKHKYDYDKQPAIFLIYHP